MPFPTFGIFTYIISMIHIHIITYWLLGENLANLSGDDVFDSLIVRLITKTVGIKDLLRRLTAHREMHEDYCAHSVSLRFF